MKLARTLLLVCMMQQLEAATLVYNMRVRRAFAVNTLIADYKKRIVLWLFSALPIWYKRTRTISSNIIPETVHESTTLSGSLFNVRLLAPHHWWAELTTGLEKQSSWYTYSHGFHTKRTGFDDIVLSAGKNWFFKGESGQFVLYGISGMPTKWHLSAHDLFDPQVGSRFYSIGFGGELSYSFLQDIKKSLIGIIQTRFIHFFNRTWSPLIPSNGHIQPGNITDAVFLLRLRHTNNILEGGYNPTFFTQQALVITGKKFTTHTFVRNSIFGNYIYMTKNFLGSGIPGAFGAGCSVGRAKQSDTKLLGLWLNLSILV